MKSVMQEASSIAKAFEQAWEKAGKPQQCSVKVLEEPRHNFIGMTIQSAKIALFFDDLVISSGNAGQVLKNERQASKPQERKGQSGVLPRNDGQSHPNKPQPQQQSKQSAPRPSSETVVADQSKDVQKSMAPRPDYWSEEMISFARNWLQDFLVVMERTDVKFQVDANKFYLRFSFEKPVYEDEQRERELFRHTSCLLLQTLRNKFSRPLKGYKIVLARA
jgi:hypothetical protein